MLLSLWWRPNFAGVGTPRRNERAPEYKNPLRILEQARAVATWNATVKEEAWQGFVANTEDALVDLFSKTH